MLAHCRAHGRRCSISRKLSLLLLVDPVIEDEQIGSYLLISYLYVCPLSVLIILVQKSPKTAQNDWHFMQRRGQRLAQKYIERKGGGFWDRGQMARISTHNNFDLIVRKTLQMK